MIIKRDIILFISRIILGIIFLISGILKLFDPVQFSEAILNYQVMGRVLSGWIAAIIPTLEIILGLGLVTGIWLPETLILTAGLYFIFDVMIAQALIRGLDVSCGCFNPSGSDPIDFFKIMQNVVLTSLSFGSVFLIFRDPGKSNTQEN